MIFGRGGVLLGWRLGRKFQHFIEGAASSAPTLGQIMRAFKSISAIQINKILARKGQPVWQRSYFDRIVRRGKDLENIRRYVAENPQRWGRDEENPERT